MTTTGGHAIVRALTERGVDLVFYLSSLVLLFLCFNLYLGQKALEDRLTLVVRELALQPHRPPPPDESRRPEA